MLTGTLRLHDVEDVEGLCAFILQRANLELSYHDSEDCLAFLVESTWELSIRFEPGAGRFSVWASAALRHRVIDWQRSRKGRTKWQFSDRTYERTLPSFVSYEAEIAGPRRLSSGQETSNDDTEHGELGRALVARYVDPSESRSPDLMRVLGAGASESTQPDGAGGKAADRVAA